MPLQKVIRALVAAGLVAGLSAAPATAAGEMANPAERPIIVTGSPSVIAPDLFGTVALPVRPVRYLENWQRASQDASGSPAMARLIAPAQGLAPVDQMYFVQGEVGRRIRWISDATEWGHHDYWASARQTLQRGAGDAEDRAIVKLQALKALGFRHADLYLTIGKEKIGGPAITVLLVRVDGRFYVLDDWSGPPIPIERRKDFAPILSFSANSSWLHGKRVAAAGGSPTITRK